ncbi:unnamed protein product [Rhizoctonia solani]|uniref:CHAT domain-containing protein n=1 Tax=Rhizoctonia solani TaxID=456999 RepID=A0A8H3AQ97_9AGAM|nr:unnamed protein product [Rhizoctonia solani]
MAQEISGNILPRSRAADAEMLWKFILDAVSKQGPSVLSNENHEESCGVPQTLESPGTNELEELNQAIDFYTHALSHLHDGGDSTPIFQALIGAYATRFQLRGEFKDITAAITYCTQAAAELSKGDSNLPRWVGDLGTLQMLRFDHFGDPEDLDCAIENQSLAMNLTASGSPQLPLRLDMLGLSHLRRFERLGNPEDIHLAVDYNSQAITLTPDDDPDLSKELCNLGIALQARFEHFGVLEDIDRSIEATTRALDGICNPRDKALALKNLGICHMSRFLRLKHVSDIDTAIQLQTTAISHINDNDIEPDYFSALGNSHSVRFEHLGHDTDLSSAIDYHTQAMSLTLDGDPEMPARLTNLGISHFFRFEYSGQLEDLDTAIECHSLAVSLSSSESSYFPGRLSNLGSCHAYRFEQTGKIEHLHMGIEYLARSIDLLPKDSSDLSARLLTLGALYLKRFIRQSDLTSWDLALDCWERSSLLESGYPETRFKATIHWADSVSLSSPDRLQAYAQAMSLIPHVVWLGNAVELRYKDAPLLENIATDAAAAAICAQNYNLALEWLEQGRSVIWNQTLQLRSPIQSLSDVDSDLADKLIDVAKRLDNVGASLPVSSVNPKSPGQELGVRRRRLAEQYEKLVGQARLIPGFEDFLKPKKASDFLCVARSGPIVILNVATSQCDALIILPNCNEVSHVPLPNISKEKAKKIQCTMDATFQRRGIRAGDFVSRNISQPRAKQQPQSNEVLGNVLGVLWRSIVKPVLDFLGYKRQETTETLPHITWCATGVLSSLPLHASGDYGRSSDRLFDFAISSYTPTLGALLAPSSTPKTHSRLLAIGQEHTPKQASLPATVEELNHIQQIAYQNAVDCLRLDGSRATRAATMEAITSCDWVHLACHACQNTEDPTQSGFFLHDGLLTLAEVTTMSLKDKGLAFLSACQTAKGDKGLPDESMHLASGMLIAGYPSVVATMWSIMDSDAPLVTQTVYGRLIRGGNMNFKDTAKALHIATSELRAQIGEVEFARWAPYIHLGQ